MAKSLNAPAEEENDIDVYAKPRKDHNSMADMYQEIPYKALETHKFGSIYYLLSGLPTINTILRHSLLPKSGDHRMIRGHSINLLHLFDVPQKFKVMSLIIKIVKRTIADQKRSCGYAPRIQMLISSKMGKGTYLVDKEHLPLRSDFEDNEVVMDASHPTCVKAQEKREKAKAEKAAKLASAPDASQVIFKTKQDQLSYLIEATLRIEKGLATLTQNQESLERIIQQKIYDLDVNVTEIQSTVEKIQEELEDRNEGQTSTYSFVEGLLSMPSTHTRATS